MLHWPMRAELTRVTLPCSERRLYAKCDNFAVDNGGGALANDQPMLEAFAKGWEVHTLTTCEIFGWSYPKDKAHPHDSQENEDWRELRALQTGLQHGGLDVVDSYVSLTETSEYTAGMPQEHLNGRLYPDLPPKAPMPAWCFYPMSKKREGHANWFTLPFEDRKSLMMEHGTSGRKFAGRVVQYVTGSAGVDDFEWGVTLFAVTPDVLKEVVYTMRFDEASALYGEFGAFYTGFVVPVDELVTSI